MFKSCVASLATSLILIGPCAEGADVVEKHSGHVQWSTLSDGSKEIVIAGPAAERAFNDSRAEPYSDDQEYTKKHLGPLDCWYLKNGLPLSNFQRLAAFLRGWDDSDLHYVCWVMGLP